MKKILALLLLVTAAHAANVAIKDLPTTAPLANGNDYTVFDGTSSGTRKILAKSIPLTVTTRAALAALVITSAGDGDVELVLGASAAGDGAGSPYYWSAASTATPNGNTVILPASSPGTGRWLKAVGGIGVPGASTLGGVFSNAGASHSFVSAINTDGTVTLTIPAASDITGLGTMATQAASSVTITGGSVNGTTVGASSASTGAFTTLTSTGGALNGTLGAGTPATVAGTTGNFSGLVTGFGLNLTSSGNGLISAVNGTTSVTTALIGNANGTFVAGVATDGHGYAGTSTNNPFYLRVNNSEVFNLTATGVNGTAIGASTAASGFFTTLHQNAHNILLAGDLATVGANSLTLTTTGATNVTLPTSGTLLTSAGAVTSLAGTSNEIAASSSVGAITLSLPTALTFTSKTVTGGTFNATAFNGPLGGTTPAVVHATTLDSSSLANARTTKGNYNLEINAKDYGVLGNNSDDTSHLNDWIAAVNATGGHCVAYLPPGKYRFTSGLTAFASISYVTITGHGAELNNDTGSAGTNTFVVNSTCSNVEICGLTFTGTSTVRGSGIHIRLYSSNSSVHDCFLSGCSDFGIHVSNSGAAYSSNVAISNNVINATLGDGIHVGNAVDVIVTGNLIIGTGDDGIGVVSDSTSFPPTRVTVTGNAIYNSGGAGISGCGVRVAEANDVLVGNNSIYTSYESGIFVGRFTSTTFYNARVNIIGNKVYNATAGGAGPRGGIWLNFISQGTARDNQVVDTASGSSIAFLDINEFSIAGNFLRQSQSRAIAADDTTTSNVGSTWNSIWITNNDLDWVVANEAIYCVPASGKTIGSLTITGNTGAVLPSGNWIYYDRTTNGRVWNNTNMNSRTVAAGGTVSGVTVGNNN